MKHILFLTHYFPPEVNAPANRTYEHAIRWIQSGWDVTIITNQPNHPRGLIFSGYRNRLLLMERMDGIRVIRVKTYLTPNKGNLRRVLNYLFYFIMSIWASFYVKQFDYLVATSPQFFCGLAGTVISKIRRKPFILEIRDLWPDSIVAVDAMRQGVVIRFLRWLEKAMYLSANKIVTLTEGLKTHIINVGYSVKQVVTISNGIDLARLSVIDPPENGLLKHSSFVFSYVGTFGMAHNLQTVLQTASILRDIEGIQFLLIGDGAEREKLLTMKKEMNLENLNILPLQPKKFVPYFLKISDVGLIMLKNSSLFKMAIPSKMFEYMGMCKPLLLSAPSGEASNIVDRYKCGMHVPADQPQLLAEQCLFFFENREQAVKMGKNGYKAAKQYYNRDVLAAKMLELFQEIVD